MDATQRETDERTNLTGSNMFELLLFSLGCKDSSGNSELFGINVFKVREIVTIPTITAVAGAGEHAMGVAHLREQVIPVFDLPGIIGCQPEKKPQLMIITEYARSVQAFAVEAVEDIVRLHWDQVISAETSDVGKSLVTSIARLEDKENKTTRLIQVLDVEEILHMVDPMEYQKESRVADERHKVNIKPGSIALAADDSAVARSMLE